MKKVNLLIALLVGAALGIMIPGIIKDLKESKPIEKAYEQEVCFLDDDYYIIQDVVQINDEYIIVTKLIENNECLNKHTRKSSEIELKNDKRMGVMICKNYYDTFVEDYEISGDTTIINKSGHYIYKY